MPSLVIVSNRLPVSLKKVNGKFELYGSSGGLATGLSSYAKRPGTKWIGWPGLPSDDLSEADKLEITRLLKRHRCYPIFISQEKIDAYYSDYSNGVLWPLFHDLKASNKPSERLWKAYREVNQQFANEVLRLSEPGSTVWIHDYQLMLVPNMLRIERPSDKIGFFLHIPFPDPKYFLKLPHAQDIMIGMLGADLLGFHTAAYTESFLSNCRGLGLDSQNGMIDLGTRVLQATEFPMGIDYGRFAAATRQKSTRAAARELRQQYRGQKIILTVDRLDPSKGLVERMQAYQRLLRQNPDLCGHVTMVMIVAPSRTDVSEYKKLKARLDELLAEITDEFATKTWHPIDFMYEVVPLERVMEYYLIADVAFIAPLRDGMNLVAKEFIASQSQKRGVLVLSETAGAAEELKDAIQVNPAKPHSVVSGLKRALELPAAELQRRTIRMQKHLRTFTVQNWADTFIDSLQKPRAATPGRVVKTLSVIWRRAMLRDYRKAGKRLLIFDYDGTLAPIVQRPEDAVPSEKLLKSLQRLARNNKNEVVVISGRDRQTLQSWLGDLPIALAAEHGAFFRRKGGKNWHRTSSVDSDWKRPVLQLFERYAAKTPGTMIEQKEWALVWHYRTASAYTAQKNLVHLKRLLKPVAAQYGLSVKEGKKILEVHPADVNKGKIAREWLIHDHDFILSMGDDVTDEDMFAVMPPQAYSVKIGRGPTYARFRLKNVEEVHELLAKL